MSKEVIEKALEKEVTKKIEEGDTHSLESEVEKSVVTKLKKAGSFDKVANKVIQQTKTIQKKEITEGVAPSSPRKSKRSGKRDGHYLRDW